MSESGELESEIDQVTLANMIKIEKNAKKLSLLELTEKTCKWPIGDPATSEFWFCGHPSGRENPIVKLMFLLLSTCNNKKRKKTK